MMMMEEEHENENHGVRMDPLISCLSLKNLSLSPGGARYFLLALDVLSRVMIPFLGPPEVVALVYTSLSVKQHIDTNRTWQKLFPQGVRLRSRKGSKKKNSESKSSKGRLAAVWKEQMVQAAFEAEQSYHDEVARRERGSLGAQARRLLPALARRGALRPTPAQAACAHPRLQFAAAPTPWDRPASITLGRGGFVGSGLGGQTNDLAYLESTFYRKCNKCQSFPIRDMCFRCLVCCGEPGYFLCGHCHPMRQSFHPPHPFRSLRARRHAPPAGLPSAAASGGAEGGLLAGVHLGKHDVGCPDCFMGCTLDVKYSPRLASTDGGGAFFQSSALPHLQHQQQPQCLRTNNKIDDGLLGAHGGDYYNQSDFTGSKENEFLPVSCAAFIVVEFRCVMTASAIKAKFKF